MTKIKWDLSDFYSGIDDPKMQVDRNKIESLATEFTKKYKNNINSKKLTASHLLSALTDYEKILEKLNISYCYLQYLFTTNTKSDKIKNAYQKSQEFYTQINSKILWFELEWINLDDKEANEILKNPSLSGYKHFLSHIRILKPFTLSEKEEQILSQKSQTSGSAFVRLYDQIEASSEFEIEIKGKKKLLSTSELTSLFKTHPDRKIREKGIISASKGHEKNASLYTYILNTLILDKKINDKIRNHSYPQESTFLSYEVKPQAVANMSSVVQKTRNIVEKFYLAKKSLLGVKKLYEWDRYSNIYNSSDMTYTWEESKEIILSSFSEFSTVFYDIAKMFFENNWIDAQITPGKRSGAYCSYNVPSKHPLVFMNFSGKVEDVTTLAHELGHAIHAYLSRDQKLLEFYPSTAMAEVASTFAEAVVFEKLYNSTKNKKDKINLLGGRIQNSFATIFRQNDFYIFESKLHELRNAKGELTENDISNLYQQLLQKTFGKGLTLTNNHKNFWMPVSHFYHYNFYVFAYVFGELLAVSIFSKYKKSGSSFVEKYLTALSKGGSMTPLEIAKIMDIDLDKKDFWKNGLKLIENDVKEFVKLASSTI